MKTDIWKLIPSPSGADLLPVKLPAESDSLDAASVQLPGGAYTTFRTFDGCKTLGLEQHLQRLESTARLAGVPIQLNQEAIRIGLRRLLLEALSSSDIRFRVTVDLEQSPGEVYLAVEPLVIPPISAYQHGVKVITCELQRQLPKAKLTRFIARSRPVRQALPPDINEAIMIDPAGYLLEGLSSNFFAVKSGALYTAEQDVLDGITRSLVLQAADRISIAVNRMPIHRSELPQIDEAFITSSSRGVLPVRQIEDLSFKGGVPGVLTQHIMTAYKETVQSRLEMI